LEFARLASLGPMGLRIARAELAVAAAQLDAVAAFYEQTLGFAVKRRDGRVVVPVGADALELVTTGDGTDPFHHFALLVPGDRFDAARAWLGERAETLARDDGGTVFPFDFWDARAVYFHDPAGNIVELIAHAGTAEGSGVAGGFSAVELAGLSEIGIVVDDPAAAVAALELDLGLEFWSGDAAQLAFVGAKAHTLILAPPGRGWLPTGRPAEPHAATVTVTGGTRGAVVLAGSPERSVLTTG
jgi:catechol 2,3-dioxygenase-like lactoylglutathione lyase family enzyme